MKSKLFLIVAIVAFLTLLGLAWKAGQSNAPAAKPETREAATLWEVRMPDPAGKTQDFAQWRGKVLVVNFWAPWCPPCRKEMPGFVTLQQKYAARGVQFVGIALDEPDNVKQFLREFEPNYPILLGGEPGYQLSYDLGNNSDSLPYTVVLDRQGQVALRKVGYLEEERLEGVLKSLL